MAESKLRALVVGSGWGRNHALAYAAHSGVELIGICGRGDSERSQRLARELQVPLHSGLEATLAEVRPDIVSCATKEADHEAVTCAALRAGADVYCEKMLADTVAGAERMQAVADETGRRLMVGYNYRYSLSALQLKQWIVEGRLGQISFLSAMTFGYCLHHTLDLVCHLAGSPVVSVFCVFDPGDDFPTVMKLERYEEFAYSAGRVRSITLCFADGAVGTLISSDCMRSGHPGVRVDVVGTEARCNQADVVGPLTLYTQDRTAEQFLPSMLRDRLDLPSTTQAAVTAWCDAIIAGEPTPVPGTDGVARLKIEKALLMSAEQGRVVPLAEVTG